MYMIHSSISNHLTFTILIKLRMTKTMNYIFFDMNYMLLLSLIELN